MPSTAKSTGAAKASENAFVNVSANQQEAMDGFMEMSQAIFNGLVEYNKELTNFIAGRVVTDLELQQRLFDCKSVEDVTKLQGEFVETAMSQYSEEAQKLAKMGADVIKKDLEAVGRHVKPMSTGRNTDRKRSA